MTPTDTTLAAIRARRDEFYATNVRAENGSAGANDELVMIQGDQVRDIDALLRLVDEQAAEIADYQRGFWLALRIVDALRGRMQWNTVTDEVVTVEDLLRELEQVASELPRITPPRSGSGER